MKNIKMLKFPKYLKLYYEPSGEEPIWQIILGIAMTILQIVLILIGYILSALAILSILLLLGFLMIPIFDWF